MHFRCGLYCPCGNYDRTCNSIVLFLIISTFLTSCNVKMCCRTSTFPGSGSAVAWWFMPRTLDPEVGGSSPTRVKPCCVHEGTFTPRKVLVIPRTKWLRPYMTEKLFTGTLRINEPTNQPFLGGRYPHPRYRYSYIVVDLSHGKLHFCFYLTFQYV